MGTEGTLARLAAQAAEGGGELAALRALIAEAGELGADRALARLGLADEGARADIDELRVLLRAWRDAKASAWKATLDWAVRGCLALLLVGIAMRLGVGGLLK